jgi:PPOX class probable F420-dependent enzyme
MTDIDDPDVRALLDGRSLATAATLGPRGEPHASVVWFQREGGTVVFSTTATRQKARNLARDPRISLSVFALDDPYTSLEIRGVAELIPDPDRRLPRELSHRYLGTDPPDPAADEVRLIVRVTPTKVVSTSP